MGSRQHARAAAFDQLVDLLLGLESHTVGGAVDQLEHSLQVATRARRAGAGTDLVFGALMHDVGRLIRPEAHGRASAELIAPFVSPETYWIVRVHDEIMLRFVEETPGLQGGLATYETAPWFPAARTFAEQWDRYGFAPNAGTLPLSFFLPLVRDHCLR